MDNSMVKSTNFVIFMVIFSRCTESYMFENISFAEYNKWIPTGSRREDLFCPETCVDDYKPLECCACSALPCWRIDAGACGMKVEELYVEYTDPFGNATLVPSVDTDNSTLFVLRHTNGRLNSIPDNICEFAESLVEIDLQSNNIGDIEVIRCLKVLDTLKLDHNRISQLPNGTFSEMEFLRILSMTHNDFQDLGPYATSLKQGNIFTVDFSYNIFRGVDITNILKPGEFCQVNFKESEIEYQTNAANYVLEETAIQGPGKIDFTGSKGHTWMNFSSLGVPHYSEFGKYFDLTFAWDNSSVHCDCNIVPFLRDLGNEAYKYWPALEFDFTCETPERMKGVSLTKIFHDADYDDLTCDLEVCPSGCSCTDKQSQDKVTVTCKDLRKFPEFMPVGYWGNIDIELDLDGNSITQLPNRDYFSRVSVLNLKGNALQHLDPNAVKNLRDVPIDMSNHTIERLPETFYNLDPNKINFGENPVVCDCDNMWIGDWIRTKGSNPQRTYLSCQTSKGVVSASLVTADFLDCPEPTTPLPTIIWILAAAILILVAATPVIYYFRYEILLLKRRATFKRNEEELNANEYDVFLSFSEENEEVFTWARTFLLPFLNGYSTFIPLRDIAGGDERDHAARTAIKNSRNFIVVLCKEYLHDFKSCDEFDTIWKYFSMDTKKQIIVINYDHFNSPEIKDQRLRAFTRINYDLNYRDRETKMQSRLGNRLGQRGRRVGQRETREVRSADGFDIEPVTAHELSLPAVVERRFGGRRSLRYQVKTGNVQSFWNDENGSIESSEILPNTPMGRETTGLPCPSKTRFRMVNSPEIVYMLPEKK